MSGCENDFPSDPVQGRQTEDTDPMAEGAASTKPDDAGENAPPGESSRERDLCRARQAVEQTPDVREDRVAAAKRALASGKLTLRGADLAEALLRDALHRVDPDA